MKPIVGAVMLSAVLQVSGFAGAAQAAKNSRWVDPVPTTQDAPASASGEAAAAAPLPENPAARQHRSARTRAYSVYRSGRGWGSRYSGSGFGPAPTSSSGP